MAATCSLGCAPSSVTPASYTPPRLAFAEFSETAHHMMKHHVTVHTRHHFYRSIISPSLRGFVHATPNQLDSLIRRALGSSHGDAYVSAVTIQDFVETIRDGCEPQNTRRYRQALHRRLISTSRGGHFLFFCIQSHTKLVTESFVPHEAAHPPHYTRGWRWALVLLNIHSGTLYVADGRTSPGPAVHLMHYLRHEPQFPLSWYLASHRKLAIQHIRGCMDVDDVITADYCGYAVASALASLNQHARLPQYI